MITIALIEDEPAIREEITYLVKQEQDTRIVGWSDNVKDALLLISRQKPDVLLMDIQLRDGTAFDILKNLDPAPEHVVFITAYNQFAIKAIKFGALDYLLKPVVQQELQEALDRYRQKREKSLPDQKQQFAIVHEVMQQPPLPEHIALNNVNSVDIVKVLDIVYCKGDGPYTYFFLANGSRKVTSRPLKYYEELLPAPHFLRTHQSYLVNKEYVAKIYRSEYLVLKNNEEIPISSRRKQYVLNNLNP